MIRTSTLSLVWLLASCVDAGPDKAPVHGGDTASEVGDSGGEVDSESTGDSADTSDTSVIVDDSDSSIDSDSDSADDTSGGTDTAAATTVDLSTAADAKLIGERAGDAYPDHIAVAGAGDVNGDGHSDLLVGMVGNPGTGDSGSGSTYLVHGPISGDIDLSSATAKLEGSDSEFSGMSVDGAGDTNGDGYADILVGAPYYGKPGDTEGQAYVVLGPVTGEVKLSDSDAFLHGELDVYTGGTAFSYTGESVASAGDTDGDGNDDMLVGARGLGAAYLVLGPVSGLFELSDSDVRVQEPSDSLGYGVSSGGDTNGDGLADILMGQPRSTAASMLLFTGPVESDSTASSADAVFSGPDGFAAGGAPRSAGDVDGDGYGDVLLDVPADNGYGERSGAAYLYLGPFFGDVAITDAQAKLVGVTDYGYASVGIDGAGDVDGDGFADFAIGAPETWYDGPGTTWLIYGVVSGTVSLDEADVQIIGEGDDQSGYAVAGAGDVDADGRADLLIGGPGDDDGGTDAGAAWLVLASSM